MKSQQYSHFSVHKQEYFENCTNPDFVICVVHFSDGTQPIGATEIHNLAQKLQSVRLDQKWQAFASVHCKNT